MEKLAKNLSRNRHPCPEHATMVVSDTKDRLSPNTAPPITVATHNAVEKPEPSAIAIAIGVISVIVPTEVPIEVEIKQLITNNMHTVTCDGVIERTK